MNKLVEKRNALMKEIETLAQTAENETRSFTDEESTKYIDYKKQIDSLDEQIARNKEIRSLALSNSKNDDTSDIAEKETRAFEMYLKGAVTGDKTLETRANMTYGDNGAVIPKTIVNKIIDKVVNISPLFAAATKYTIKGDITIPYVNTANGDITVAFADEFSTLTASNVKISSIELKGYLAGSLVVSRKLINHSQFDIVSFVINRMAQKIAIFIENFLINGDTNKSTKSGLKNSVTQKIALETGDSITGDILIDVQDTIPDVYQANAFWLMSPKTRTLIRKLKDGQNNYLLIKDFSSPTGYTLLGKPVYVSDNITPFTTAVADDDFLYYGDFSGLAVKIGEDPNLQVLNEIYATQHGTGFVAWLELDNTVEDPQKIVKAAIVAK